MLKQTVVMFALLSMMSSSAFADELVLKDGSKLEGKILVREDEAVYFETAGGSISDIPMHKIESINGEVLAKPEPQAEPETAPEAGEPPPAVQTPAPKVNKAALEITAENGFRQYELETGVVQYEMRGNPKSVEHMTVLGSETIYFKKWGLLETRHSKMEIGLFGTKANDEALMITDGAEHKEIDLNKKTGVKSRSAMSHRLRNYPGYQNYGAYSEDMLTAQKAVRKGTETILDRTCEVWQYPGSGQREVCIWKGIPLRETEHVIDKEVTSIAVAIEENPKIPKSRFKAPLMIRYEK